MNLPTHARLAAGTRLLNPFTGTHYKYGGRFVHVKGWTEDGKVVVRMKMPLPDPSDGTVFYYDIFFHVDAETIGLKTPMMPVQQELLPARCPRHGGTVRHITSCEVCMGLVPDPERG